MTRWSQYVAAAVAVFSLLGAHPAYAGQAERPKLVPVMKGPARVEITKPNTKVTGKEILTTILMKNIENRPIAGLRVEEHWYDKAGAPVAGTTYRHPRPFQPGEVITIVLKTPRTPQLSRNQYTFAHINGQIKQTVVPKLVAPKQAPPKPTSD
jgi:hypothetical protein